MAASGSVRNSLSPWDGGLKFSKALFIASFGFGRAFAGSKAVRLRSEGRNLPTGSPVVDAGLRGDWNDQSRGAREHGRGGIMTLVFLCASSSVSSGRSWLLEFS